MQRLIGSILEQPELEIIRFENQPSKGWDGIPDAVIHSSMRLLLETKTELNGIRRKQIDRHLARLDIAVESTQILLVLTPDEFKPAKLNEINDPRLVWSSFVRLSQAIDTILDDPLDVVSEREAFLLRELQKMLEAENLLGSPFDVVVVAARNAWPEYREIHAYVCQAGRSIQQVDRIGFYYGGAIQPILPKILGVYDNVKMGRNLHKGDLGILVNRLVDEKRRLEGEHFKVYLLSAPEDKKTMILNREIQNDKQSSTGKPTAFTMGQRYVLSERLKEAEKTSQLDT
ncbi:hypothetical protein [Polystyrenella longa]|nr:hypothetical protein [Polystyrenella longa]